VGPVRVTAGRREGHAMDERRLEAQIAELRAYLAELRGESPPPPPPPPDLGVLPVLLTLSAIATALGLRAELHGAQGTAADGRRLLAVPHAALLLTVMGALGKERGEKP